MSHPGDIQIEQYISHDLNWLRALLVRWHLARCPQCRQRVEEAERERALQKDIGTAVQHYTEAAAEAEKTLRLPKPPTPPEQP